MELFGRYIHTYKFSGAVEDGVVLDLVYEARDIEQEFGSEGQSRRLVRRQDQRAERLAKRGAKEALGHHAAGAEFQVADGSSGVRASSLTSASSQELSSEHGNAILVTSSIYEACKYFALFQRTLFKGRCAW